MKVPNFIMQQTQPTALSCTSTCLAMLLGVPTEEVIEEFHEDYMDGKNVDEYLSTKGLKAQPLLSTYRLYEEGGVYLVGIPSLNIQGAMHQVVFDYRDESNFRVLDPNYLKPYKKYYVYKPEKDLGSNEVNILSWTFEYKITGE